MTHFTDVEFGRYAELAEIRSEKTRSPPEEEKSNKNINPESRLKSCRGCYVSHSRTECRFKKAVCYNCGKTGHVKAVCGNSDSKVKDRKRMKDDNTVKWIGEKVNNLEVLKKRIIIKLAIQDVMVDFLVDTGATSTLINAKTYALLGARGWKIAPQRS